MHKGEECYANQRREAHEGLRGRLRKSVGREVFDFVWGSGHLVGLQRFYRRSWSKPVRWLALAGQQPSADFCEPHRTSPSPSRLSRQFRADLARRTPVCATRLLDDRFLTSFTILHFRLRSPWTRNKGAHFLPPTHPNLSPRPTTPIFCPKLAIINLHDYSRVFERILGPFRIVFDHC
jgi:hypothetical protein